MERATELVVELLTKGITATEVARITGNTASAISQVKTTYADKILAGKAEAELAQGAHGARLDKLESLAASKLESVLDLETDSMKIARIFQTLNSAVRRDAGEAGGSGGNTITNTTQTVVQLDVPAHLRAPIVVTTNSSNDVVAVAGRDLTPASMRSINALAGIVEGTSHEEAAKQQANDDIMQTFIPGLDKASEY